MTWRKWSTGDSDGNCGGSCNAGLREEGYATNDDRAILTGDVGVKIWTGGCVVDWGLEVLLLGHCDVLAEMRRGGVDRVYSN
jgi:hypothetical protein